MGSKSVEVICTEHGKPKSLLARQREGGKSIVSATEWLVGK